MHSNRKKAGGRKGKSREPQGGIPLSDVAIVSFNLPPPLNKKTGRKRKKLGLIKIN